MKLTGDFTASSVGTVCGDREEFKPDYRLPDIRVAWYSLVRWLPPTTFKKTSRQDLLH